MAQAVIKPVGWQSCASSNHNYYFSSLSLSSSSSSNGKGSLSSGTRKPKRAVPSLVSVKGSLIYAWAPNSSDLISNESSMEAAVAAGPKWAQKTITLPPHRRGCHLITPKIMGEIRGDLSEFKCGLAHLFLQHTSASLTINENYDSDVRDDTDTFLNTIVPEGASAPWKHTLEGPDDMPAHIKSSMLGCTLTIPITDGKLNMGTWQGIWLCEHRDHPTARKVVVTLNGI